MKFADKLFLATTALLTLIFTVFGSWMLSAGFSGLLEREIERGNSESRMFHLLFEMGYRSAEDYGEEYALDKTLASITESVERDGSRCYVLSEEDVCLHGEVFLLNNGLKEDVLKLRDSLSEKNDYGYVISHSEEGFFLVTMGVADTRKPLWLGICRGLNELYEMRSALLRQYYVALIVLLSAGGISIYLLARYITRPISRLGRVAGRIAGGNYESRSNIRSHDEIGALSRSFNRMTDRLVEEMERKTLEAKQKEDFTAAFAHELKTPLTSIIGYADMLNTMKMSEQESAEATYYIYNQGKRLESLSHKLLNLVGMDRTPIDLRPVQAKRLEENVRNTVRPIWVQRKIHGKVEMDKGIIWGDEELLLSLFYNLLDNAAKAMDKGEAGFILMKGTRLADDRYEVKVVDNGRGIPESEINRITEAFYMVDKSRSRKEGGAGIGMALCNKIISLHGGSLQITSKLGEGTVMVVTFPPVMPEEEGHGKREASRRKRHRQAV